MGPIKIHSSRHIWRRMVAVGIGAVLLMAAFATSTGAQENSNPELGAEQDLRDYYPNRDMVDGDMYLEGYNYISGAAQRSVLWFEEGRRGRFKQYNSAPDDPKATCHYDELRWTRVLRYHVTMDSCGDVERRTKYSPGIALMPRDWEDGDTWKARGTSDATHSEDGDVVCRGETSWSAEVFGWVEVAPGVFGIHVQSLQTTDWTEGHSSSGCSAGFTTSWKEDYYLVPGLPVAGGGTANAFKRSLGGNLDVGVGRWDVWFDYWAPLPR